MNRLSRTCTSFLALSLLAAAAGAGHARFTFRGTVTTATNPNGPYAGVQVGDNAVLTCEIRLSDAAVVAPGHLVRYVVESMAMVLGPASVTYTAGAPVLAMQDDFPTSDGIGRDPDLIAELGGKTVRFGFTHNGSLFASANPLHNLGVHALAMDHSFSSTWTVAGGGTLLEILPSDLTIEGVEAGTLFCPGDGTGTACPCGNESPVGPGVGCLHSSGLGGRLRAYGHAVFGCNGYDVLVLEATQLTGSSVLYFQGTGQQGGGSGAVFGDGLRCAGGTLVRLATRAISAGSSIYPGPGDLPISVAGQVPSGGATRHYQAWFRNAAAFCTVASWNLTNGVTFDFPPGCTVKACCSG